MPHVSKASKKTSQCLLYRQKDPRDETATRFTWRQRYSWDEIPGWEGELRLYKDKTYVT